MVTREKLITADELLEMPQFEKGYELMKGVIVEMAPSGTEHFILAGWLTYLLTAFVEQNDLGVVGGAEGGFILSADPDTVRAPDVGFIAKARLVTPTPKGFFPGPPDLAVEVVSPGDRAGDVHDKVIEYLEAGTRLVWVVYPSSKTVVVHTPDAETRILHIDGVLEGGDVLPGLALPVRDVFKKLQE